MRIEPLPSEERYTPASYRDMAEPPVVIYRPLNARDKARWFSRLIQADVRTDDEEQAIRIATDKQADLYCDLFLERVIRIENLTIGDQPYSHELFDHLDGEFVFVVAAHIWQRAQLSDDELGKSSSSSS
jgi:hypothetical protein